MISLARKPDTIGALASGLCLIHCVATPLLFVAHTCASTCCASDAVPSWWAWIDYFFLIVSFAAVFHSAKTASAKWLGWALWLSWICLLLVIVNERMEWVGLSHSAIYFPSLALIVFHITKTRLNRQAHDACCVND